MKNPYIKLKRRSLFPKHEYTLENRTSGLWLLEYLL